MVLNSRSTSSLAAYSRFVPRICSIRFSITARLGWPMPRPACDGSSRTYAKPDVENSPKLVKIIINALFINALFIYVITVCDSARESCPVFHGRTE